MTEDTSLISLLKNEQPLVAMLAPSFPIVFNPKTICSQLKRAGFQNVVEVSLGAKQTNRMLLDALQSDDKSRFITNPCPNIVRTIRSKYPEAAKYLSTGVDSPMAATAKLVIKKFPNRRPVFIGPCLVKRLEASEDCPNLNILCATYKDIQQIFQEFNIIEDTRDVEIPFDLVEESTRLYPISGGLAQSSKVRDSLSDDDVEVVSGVKNVPGAIQRFIESDHIRLLDILFCDGGCISGPGIVSTLSLDERRQKITDYWNLSK